MIATQTRFTDAKPKPSVTGSLIESLNKKVFSRKDPLSRQRAMAIFEARLTEAYSLGEFNPLTDVDHDGVFESFCKADERFADVARLVRDDPRVWRQGSDNDKLREHVVDGLELSQFERYLDTCIRLGTIEFCSGPSVDGILGLIGGLSVDCTTSKVATDPFLIDDDFDDCTPADAEMPFAGLADPVEFTVPDRNTVQLGYAMKRDLFCGGLATRILDMIEREIGPKFNRRLARQVIPLIFEAYCSTHPNPWPFNMDGCSWGTYYAEDAASPWVNKIQAADDFDTCTYGFFCQVETLFDNLENPRTGELMECCSEYQIVSGGGRCMDEKFRNLLGVTRVESCNVDATGCRDSIMFNRNGRAGWGNFFWDRYLTRYLKERYTTLFGTGTTAGYTDAQILQMVERTWLAGCPERAFAMTTEWERERITLQGRDTWQYLNQNVLYMTGWRERTGFMVQNPWSVVLVQGVPDGETLADLVCA